MQIVRECFEFSANKGASDIHIEPKEDRLDFRVRVNGVMLPWKSFSSSHSDPIIWRAKWIVGLDLAIISNPQDGRATFNSLGTDVRANALPTLYGNKLVFRLLPHSRSFRLVDSGLSEESVEALEKAAAKNQGLILVSGPTGSGKTTTLYSLLNSLDISRKNVCTIENPIEYRMPGITQVDISEDNLTFADAMRAMLRQDPDVILFGEIRDKESASVATHAANTGHLVLSTLHTNSATEVIERLRQLGIDEWTIKSTLILASAQRLVPVLCQNCALPVVVGTSEIGGFSENENLKIVNEKGCSSCQSGVTGRVAILESIDAGAIQRYFSERLAIQNVKNLYSEACKLAEKGIIDYREATSLR